jgi:hypothetical protein
LKKLPRFITNRVRKCALYFFYLYDGTTSCCLITHTR